MKYIDNTYIYKIYIKTYIKHTLTKHNNFGIENIYKEKKKNHYCIS